MTSNYCEEADMSSKIRELHSKMAEDMIIPTFISAIKCPHCSDKYDPESIRNIGLCLNARNFGEISIELFCYKCSLMDTFYFREGLKRISGFCDILLGFKHIESNPLIEEKMYSLRYNNIASQFESNKIGYSGVEGEIKLGDNNGTV